MFSLITSEGKTTWLRELAGAVADLGVFAPLAVALVVGNGMSATAALLPAGLLYLLVAQVYRLPVGVQPLKALAAVAIANGLPPETIGAAALCMGLLFTLLGVSGLLDKLAKVFPQSLVRGVQAAVGVLLIRSACMLVWLPPQPFRQYSITMDWSIALAVGVLVLAIRLRRVNVTLILVAVGLLVAISRFDGEMTWGPSGMVGPSLDPAIWWTALVALVLPQAPLTLANACIAPVDAAKHYFGDQAERVKPGKLAITLGLANLLAGAISGLPVCHGSGGMTAHVAFGAQTWRAPCLMGLAMVLVALVAGQGLGPVFAAFPVEILAGLLAAAGVLHFTLLAALKGWPDKVVAITVGIVGGATLNLLWGLLAGALLLILMRTLMCTWKRSLTNAQEKGSGPGR